MSSCRGALRRLQLAGRGADAFGGSARRFDVIKWLALNGPEGATATDEAPVAGTSVRIELAGDDDEALMKAKREADAAEKRSVPPSPPLPHLSQSLIPSSPQIPKPAPILDRAIDHHGRKDRRPTRT